MSIDPVTAGVTAAAITKKVTLGASLLSTMVIFQDPTYVIIAGLGSFASMASAYYDYNRKECGECAFHKELLKAFLIGSLFTLLSFMLLIHSHASIIEALELDFLKNILPSFWLVLTIALATESVSLWDRVIGYLKEKKWK